MHHPYLTTIAAFGLAASAASINRRQTDDVMGGANDTAGPGGMEFEPYSDTCLTNAEWTDSNPTDYDGFFNCFARIENDDGTATLYFNGIPDSYLDNNETNPNDLCQKAEKITLPKPVKTDNNTQVPQVDLIAISVDGVKIFGPLEGGGGNAVSGSDGLQVLCDGHPQPEGVWHYHHPSLGCVVADSSTLVAWSLDGFPIYGPLNGTKDEVDAILDDCNGIDNEYSQYGYQYHVRTRDQVDETLESNEGDNNTDNWKYFLGCYRGASYTTDIEEDSLGYCAAYNSISSNSITSSSSATATSATATGSASENYSC